MHCASRKLCTFASHNLLVGRRVVALAPEHTLKPMAIARMLLAFARSAMSFGNSSYLRG